MARPPPSPPSGTVHSQIHKNGPAYGTQRTGTGTWFSEASVSARGTVELWIRCRDGVWAGGQRLMLCDDVVWIRNGLEHSAWTA